MEQITLRIPEDVLEDVETEAEDSNQSRAEYLRDVIESRHEADNIRSEFKEKASELETEVERLENEKRTLISERQEKQELMEYVEEEQSYRRAGLGQRVRWWLFGMEK